MKSIKAIASGLLISATLALTACGGGASGSVTVSGGNGGGSLTVSGTLPAFSAPAFDLIAVVDDHVVPGLQVFPGEVQTLSVPVGHTFLIDSSDPVIYSLVVGGNTIAGTGNLIVYGGVNIQETLLTPTQFGISTTSPFRLSAPVPITLYATSVYDSHQVARIDILLTN